MAQNHGNHSHGSASNQPNQGFEDLMGSLRSPGLATPAASFQGGFQTSQWQWPQNASQGSFPFSMPYNMPPLNPMAWTQNQQDGYVSFNQDGDEETFSPSEPGGFNYDGLQHSSTNGGISEQPLANQQPFPPNPIPNLSTSSPLSLPPSQLSEVRTTAPTTDPKSPAANNNTATARAAELRAKLLASRGSKSRHGSPAVKSSGNDGAAKKSQTLDVLKQQQNGNSDTNPYHELEPTNTNTSATLAVESLDSSGLNATTLDNLMAEARNAADAPKARAPPPTGKRAEEPKAVNETALSSANVNILNQQQISNESRSNSELSEPGEIRSDPGSPMPMAQPQGPPVDLPQKPVQDNQDKREKIARQNEVQKTYQPLKKPNSSMPEPKLLPARPQSARQPAKTPQAAQNPSLERRRGSFEHSLSAEKRRREQRREPLSDQDRQEHERDRRRSSLPQGNSATGLERDLAARKERTDENARRAAEYKRNLEAQKQQARQSAANGNKPSQQKQGQEPSPKQPLQNPSSSLSRNGLTLSNDAGKIGAQSRELVNGENGERGSDTSMTSPRAQTIEGNDDVSDWLELTDFYDEPYRERRLKIFRKKKALDIERAELEREEEIELQQRVHRSRGQSVLNTGTPSSTVRRVTNINVRMPPPPLPLPFRDNNNKDNGMKIKDAALSAGLTTSQKSSPTLKRQYAEDSTETSPTKLTDKRLRLDTNGPSPDDKPLMSPASAKVNGPQLETRISRYDSWAPAPRPRSRSAEYHDRRRRSSSPRGWYYGSPPPPAYRPRDFSAGHNNNNNNNRRFEDKTCFNCGERGHMLSHCLVGRRDGKECTNSRGYERYVSPNYRGKNPMVRPALTKSRVNSVGKGEKGE